MIYQINRKVTHPMSDWNYRNTSMKKAYGKGIGCATLILSIVVIIIVVALVAF